MEPVAIAGLVSPLRYDVVVRQGLFELFGRHPELLRGDPAELVRRAAATPYAVWFEQVAVARFKPHLADDRAALGRAFAERVLGAAALFSAVERHGFDARHPILLRATSPSTRPPGGKPVRPQLCLADGCHRLALLMSLGWTDLPAACYRVDTRPLAVVTDNTSLLLGPLRVGVSDYAAFLSLRYADTAHRRLEDLVEEVAARRPALLREVRAVIAADLPSLVGPPDGAAAAGRPAATP